MSTELRWEEMRASFEEDPSLQALTRLHNVYFFVKDRERRFIYFNENFCRMMGVSADQLLGQRDEQLSPEYLVEHYRPDDNAVLTSGIELNDVAELVRNKQGGYDWNITSKWPVRDSVGEIVAVAGLTRRLVERAASDDHYFLLTPAVELIARNLSRRVPTEELARAVSLSASQFRRVFQKRFGCSPQDYQRRIRVRAVCELLALTEQSLSSIAGACGYYDQSHMTNEFRSAKGITPTSYRRKFSVAPSPFDAAAEDR